MYSRIYSILRIFCVLNIGQYYDIQNHAQYYKKNIAYIHMMENTAHYFYIIGAKGKPASPSKFGHTSDLIKRREQLQTGNPDKLRYYFHAEGTEAEMIEMENAFKQRFNGEENRAGINGGAEWLSTERGTLLGEAILYCQKHNHKYKIDARSNKINS